MWENKRLKLNGKPVGEQTGVLLRSIRDVLAEAGAEDLLIEEHAARANANAANTAAKAAIAAEEASKSSALARPSPLKRPTRPTALQQPGARPAKAAETAARPTDLTPLKPAPRPVRDPRIPKSLTDRLFNQF